MKLQNSLLSHIKLISKLIFLVLVFTLSTLYVQATWSDPTSAPPQDNTPKPLNVGPDPQIKDGDLTVDNIGAINVEASGYFQVGDVSELTCDATTDGVIGHWSPCLSFCIDTGYGYEWVELACLESA